MSENDERDPVPPESKAVPATKKPFLEPEISPAKDVLEATAAFVMSSPAVGTGTT